MKKKNRKEFLLCSFAADFGHRNKSPIYHKCHKIVHFCLLIECLRVFCQTAKNALSAKNGIQLQPMKSLLYKTAFQSKILSQKDCFTIVSSCRWALYVGPRRCFLLSNKVVKTEKESSQLSWRFMNEVTIDTY